MGIFLTGVGVVCTLIMALVLADWLVHFLYGLLRGAGL